MPIVLPESMTIDIGNGVMPLKYENGKVLLLDQRALPRHQAWFDATSLPAMCAAIKDMVVRGAPSIGVAAAFGLACESTRLAKLCTTADEFLGRLTQAKEQLQSTRPTAVNLRWGTDEIYKFIAMSLNSSPTEEATIEDIANASVELAESILEEHVSLNERLGRYGSAIVPQDANIITHCNAGPLATCGWGTALGVIRSAAAQGKKVHVYVDETRPRNQGSKLTMYELHQDRIPATLMCDSMSGHLMSTRKIDLVVVGADRIAANGDTANKIGTYNLAVVAKFHKVPFYVAAPLSTIDALLPSGAGIPIEQRDSTEITYFEGVQTTVENATVYNPSFDVTPAELITGIITEKGILLPPFTESIAQAMKESLESN